MARQEVLEIKCDRCGKVENHPAKGKEIPRPEFSISFQGQKVVYEDLCRRCRGALENYFISSTKQKEETPGEDPKEGVDPARRKVLGII